MSIISPTKIAKEMESQEALKLYLASPALRHKRGYGVYIAKIFYLLLKAKAQEGVSPAEFIGAFEYVSARKLAVLAKKELAPQWPELWFNRATFCRTLQALAAHYGCEMPPQDEVEKVSKAALETWNPLIPNEAKLALALLKVHGCKVKASKSFVRFVKAALSRP